MAASALKRSIGNFGSGAIARIVLMLLALALILVTLLMFGGVLALELLPLILAGAILVQLWAAQRAGGRSERLDALAARLETSLEQLKDLQWEVRERETRYRDLLDNQDDVILRRDMNGRLSFVNDALCRTFGLARDAALGEIFHLPLADGEAETERVSLPERGEGRRSRMIELATAGGPRWFVWEDFAIADTEGEITEIQSTGRDITEQRASELALAEARDQAMSANQAKSRFLASMSHEIRTPMNGILGMTGLLLDTELSPEQRTYARAISTSAKTLLSLIDEVLDFSKIEAGKIELRQAPFDVADAAQSVVELLGPRARDKGLEIGWRAAADLPSTVIGDEMRVRQILMNLIGNAIKFTERGGVALTLARSPSAPRNGAKAKNGLAEIGAGRNGAHGERVMLRFAVRDTGPGVPPDALERIFAEFEQAESGPARRHGGTGLGLAISKRLAGEMGGEIGVASAPGAGATFTVDLPFTAPLPIESVGSGWPSPQSGEKVLIVLGGTIEPALAGDLLVEAGASIVRAPMEDAPRIAAKAAAGNAPFTALLADRAAVEMGAARLLAQLVPPGGGKRPPRAVVIIDPAERGDIPALREQGFKYYLVRPVRPVSLLTQLFGEVDEAPARARGPLHPARSRGDARPPAKGLSVLLAEDNDINALLACAVLEKSGARVVRARNGAEAVAKARESLSGARGFDLVLMDIHMPDMDGVEAARGIRALYPEDAEPARGRPPIVALTANAFAEDRAAYLAAGLDDYLAKPFEKADLAALLARWQPTPRRESGFGAA